MPDLTKTAELERRLAALQVALADSEARAKALASEVERHRRLLDTIDAAICIIEVFTDDAGRNDYRFIEVNAAFERQTGIFGAVGKSARELVPDHEDYWHDTFARVARSGRPESFEQRAAAMGRWYEVYAAPLTQAPSHHLVVHFQDTSERRFTEDCLRAREADLARVQRIGEVGGLDVEIDGLRSARSPEYLRLHGLTTADLHETHENWRRRVHPDDVAEAEAALFAALAGTSSTYDSEYRIIRPNDGAVRWIHARADIERDDSGAPVRLVGAHIDVTEQKAMQSALRESEERMAFLLNLSDALAAASDPAQIARTVVDMLALHLDAADVWYVDGVAVSARYARSAGESRSCDAFEHAMAHKDGDGARLGAEPGGGRTWTRAEQRLICEVGNRASAAIQQARADAALDKSGKQMAAIFRSAPVGIALIDRAGDIVLANDMARGFLPACRIPSKEPLGERRWKAVNTDGSPVPIEDYPGRKALRGEATVPGMEFTVTNAAGVVRWTTVSAVPMPGEEGTVDGAMIVIGDIDALKRSQQALRHSEQRLQSLLAELQHRVRNVLTVIRSVFARTMESGGDLDDVADHFRGRLDSIARSQSIATQNAAGMVDLENLVREELLSAGAGDGPQVTINGPPIIIDASLAEVLGMALHELTTNAVKFGALRFPAARLNIHWAVVEREYGRPSLDVCWTEIAVPALAARPACRGFGTELIEDVLPYRIDATTSLNLKGGGARCVISIPLPPEGKVNRWRAP